MLPTERCVGKRRGARFPRRALGRLSGKILRRIAVHWQHTGCERPPACDVGLPLYIETSIGKIGKIRECLACVSGSAGFPVCAVHARANSRRCPSNFFQRGAYDEDVETGRLGASRLLVGRGRPDSGNLVSLLFTTPAQMFRRGRRTAAAENTSPPLQAGDSAAPATTAPPAARPRVFPVRRTRPRPSAANNFRRPTRNSAA